MYSAIRNFPRQIADAIEIGKNGPKVKKSAKRVVILGMGGSAIGGDLLRSYVSAFGDRNTTDVIVNRDYNPPRVGKSDLLVASSYSGNTEETLSAYNAARKNAGEVLVITTGGTGFTGRDVTPEALEPIFEKRMDGFSEVFHRISYDKIGTSTIQSRATAGTIGATFVFVLPGSPGACGRWR